MADVLLLPESDHCWLLIGRRVIGEDRIYEFVEGRIWLIHHEEMSLTVIMMPSFLTGIVFERNFMSGWIARSNCVVGGRLRVEGESAAEIADGVREDLQMEAQKRDFRVGRCPLLWHDRDL